LSEEEAFNLNSLEVEGLISVFIGILSEKAIRYMGVPLQGEEKVEKDLKRASVAINSVSCLIDQVQALLPEKPVEQYRSLVGDLQLQYVRHAKTK
jgi:hypothetical protein